MYADYGGGNGASVYDNLFVKNRGPVTVSGLQTSTDLLMINQMYLTPNPTSDVVKINFTQITEVLGYQVYDQQGRLVRLEASIKGSGDTIDVSSLPTGTYFVKATAKNGDSFSQQLMIKK